MSEDFCCYDVQKNDVYGRFAVASKKLYPGDLITSELPFMFGPKSDSPPVCLGCHLGVDGTKLCSKCRWPVCNAQCEKLPIHAENECIIFSKAKIKFTPVEDVTLSCPQYECIMPLRVLLEIERNPESWENDVKNMESHIEERKKKELWHVETVNIVEFLRKACKLEDRFSEDHIHLICGILEVNAFVAPAGLGYDLRCLYPKTSLLTHSCIPNVGHYIFPECEGGKKYRIYVRAMVEIEKGQVLYLSYTQTLWPTLLRRDHLKDGKYFDCTCRRCADPTELETNLSTLKCTKCDNGWVLSSNSLDATSPWKCTHCEFQTKGESVMKTFEIIQREIEELEYSRDGCPVAAREAFIKKYRSVLHPSNALLLTVKISLTQLYGKMEGYLLEELPDVMLERKIELCDLINKISLIVKPGISRQRGWNLYEWHAPIIILARSKFHRGEINKKQLRVELEKAAEYLEESALIFSYDDPYSPEGVVSRIAFQSLEELKKSIDTLPK